MNTFNIDNETIAGFDSLLSKGASKDKLEGFLLFNEVSKKDALAYLKERGLIGRVTFRSWLTQSCYNGFVGIGDFKKEIEKASRNVQHHGNSYNNERVAYNRIHAKYDPAIAKLVEEELAVKGSGGAKPKGKAPKKPTTLKGLYKSCIGMCHPDKANGDAVWMKEMSQKVNAAKDRMMILDGLWDEIVAHIYS